MRFRDGKRLQFVLRRRKIHGAVEVGRTSEYRSDGALDRLNDLAVGGGVEAAHAIAIEEVDAAFLARADQQVLVRQAAGEVRKEDGTAGTEVDIRLVEIELVERREVIDDSESREWRA